MCRALDLAIIVLVSPVLLALGAGIAAWIKAVSPGRVLFSQTRVGFSGRPFTIFKFRSMRENAETGNHREHVAALAKSEASMTKLDETGDARLIPLGRCLRRTALDELPQVINVLRGEMSIVGPRPCLDYEYHQYHLYSAAQRERFETLPGITGYWQVNGKNSTTFEQMVKLDIHYVRRRSVWLNLGIILRTPLVITQQIFGRASRVRLQDVIAANRKDLAGSSTATHAMQFSHIFPADFLRDLSASQRIRQHGNAVVLWTWLAPNLEAGASLSKVVSLVQAWGYDAGLPVPRTTRRTRKWDSMVPGKASG